ncbi:rubrerythrin family protein [Amycolatopsis sp. NPDC003676]
MTELTEQLSAELSTALTTEAMAVQRYTYFARIAEIEGHREIAQLFTELAETTSCVAHGHLDLLQPIADPATAQPIGDTRLNLASALAGGLRDADEHYPRRTAAAHAAGCADVASWLTSLAALKHTHVARINDALATVTAVAGQGSATE